MEKNSSKLFISYWYKTQENKGIFEIKITLIILNC
jgi:hypothetical protein